MTPLAAKEWLIRKAWYETGSQAPDGAHEEAATALNAALQELWASPAAELWARQEYSLATDGFSVERDWIEKALDSTIRGVPDAIVEVWCAGYELTRCESLIQFRSRANLYSLSASTVPRYWWLESRYAGRANTAAEARSGVLMVSPIPEETETITFMALTEPPNYSSSALQSSSGAIPMPESEVESLLLPLAGLHLCSSTYVLNPPVREHLIREGMAVRHKLGISTPAPNQKEAA
jgi:hypothetical protein